MKWKFFLIVPLIISGTLLLILSVPLLWPNVLARVVNQNIHSILDFANIEARMETFDLKIDSVTLFKKNVQLRCIKCDLNVSESLALGVKDADLNFAIDYRMWGEWIEEIKESSIDELIVHVSPSKEEEEKESSSNLPEFINRLRIAGVSIKDSKILLVDETGKNTTVLFNVAVSNTDMWKATFDSTVRQTAQKPVFISGKLNGNINLESLEKSQMSADAQITSEQVKVDFLLQPKSQSGNNEHSAKLSVTMPDIVGQYSAIINLTAKKYLIGFKSNTKISGTVPVQISNQSCVLGGSYKMDPFRTSSKVEKCEFVIDHNANKEVAGVPIALPKKMVLNVLGDFRWNTGDKVGLEYLKGKVGLQTFSTALYEVDGGVTFSFDKETAKGEKIIAMDSKLKLKIKKVEDLVQSLNKTRLAIPAPFNTLKGPLECNVKGKIEIEGSLVRVPHNCMIDLKGGNQLLSVYEKGFVEYNYDKSVLNIESDTVLDDIAFTMPDLRVTSGMPNIVRDKRFVSAEEYTETEKEEDTEPGLVVNYKINIKTRRPTKVTLPSLSTTVPIDMKVSIDSRSGLQGEIAARSFELKVVKKPIEINRVRLVFKREVEEPLIDAVIKMERSDLDLIVSIEGTISDPRVNLSSDPVRPQQEIISQLVYGNSYVGLGTQEQQAVGDTKAALAEGAISMISMLYLASTPVESVGFNPASKEFSAQFDIGGAGSLSVGKQVGGDSKISYSRRIKGNWYLQTEASNASDGSSIAKGIAMMRWIQRF